MGLAAAWLLSDAVTRQPVARVLLWLTIAGAILGIPTLMFFKGGKLQERLTGFMPKDKLVAKLSPHL